MKLIPLKQPLPIRAFILPWIDLISAASATAVSWAVTVYILVLPIGIETTIFTMMVVVMFWAIGPHFLDGYSPFKIKSRRHHIEVVGKIAGIYFTGLLLLIIFFGYLRLSAGFTFISTLIIPCGMLIGRSIGIQILHLPKFQRNVIIIGAGWAGRTIVREILSRPAYGYRPVGFLDHDVSKHGEVVEGVPVLGCHSDLLTFLKEMRTDFVVVAITRGTGSDLITTLYQARGRGVTVVRMTEIYEMLTQRVPVEHLPEHWVNEFVEGINGGKHEDHVMRKVINYILGLLLFIISIPFMLLVALLILVFDGRPVLFSQDRVGKNEKLIRLYKFRTMREASTEDDEGSIGESWVRRITRTGNILRITRLDELPQLINVIKGELSLVGPRPFIPSEVSVLSREVPCYQLRFLVRPGVTGHAQILAGYENKPETALRKLEYDLFYIKYQSIWFDLLLLLRTISAVLSRRGQ